MSEFYFGLVIGGLVVGAITIPFLLRFGVTHYNVKRLEKIAKEMKPQELSLEIPQEDFNLIQQAESILKEHYTKKK